MKSPVFRLLLLVLTAGGSSLCTVRGQGSADDYERADGLAKRFENRVFRDRVDPTWLPEEKQFWYRVETGPDRHTFMFVDAEKGERREAFDHERLAKMLSAATDTEVSAEKLPFSRFRYGDSSDKILFTASGSQWQVDLTNDEVTEIEGDGQSETTLEVLNRPMRSSANGPETHVEFVNRLDALVSLYWLDREGERIAYGTIAPNGNRRQHTYAGHVWLVADAEGRPLLVVRAGPEEGKAVIDGSTRRPERGRRNRNRNRRRGDARREGATSPDGKWRARIQNHNVELVDVETGESTALSSDGTEEDAYEDRFIWSPDSAYLAVVQETKVDEREVHFVESSPDDQLQPRLHTFGYAKPGDPMPVARPRLFEVAKARQIPVSTDLFPNAWSVSRFHWLPDSSAFLFLYNQRGHQILSVISVNPESGKARAVIHEESPTFIDYAHKTFIEYVDETNEIIWMSERDGWNHLYLYDAITGEVKNQITKGSWVVRGVERVDREKREIWFEAGGIVPGEDPYFVHLCRVGFDGSGLTRLTDGDGTHRWEFSPNGDYFIDRWSRVDHPPVHVLRRSDDGSLICSLEEADWSSLLDAGWRFPERFTAKGRDGETDIFGVIYRPMHLDENRSYPVIEAIYAGPQSSFVPKDFAVHRNFQSLAELGFIVVKIDGMGTSHRSKAFHDVCWKNLGDSGFPDRIRWIRAAAERYPYMDLERVGIYGGSAGGQSTVGGLLAHGDFYKVGVADCGCHDNRMDKIWWNELWMGWPIGDHYREQSNVTQAHRLSGKLLLTVGEMDRNVDPASTMQLVNALIEADKDFDLVIFPGAGHGIGESAYGKRRRADFFVRHLLGREPRWKS